MATKIASLYAEISGDTSKLQSSLGQAKTGLKGFGGQLNDVVKQMTGFNLGSLTIAGGLLTVGKFLIDTTKETQAYNLAMVDTARIMGTTTEEASRLVQVGDDVRLSQDQIRTAMVYAAKNGIEPNIAGLAKLADQYLALAPGMERDQLLLKSFGRSGADMGKLLEKGGDGIRSMSDAIDKNLIVTEEAGRASKRYYDQVDRLNDSWKATKMTIGNGVIPTMANLLEAINRAGYSVGGFKTIIEYSKVKLEQHAIASGYAAEEAGFLANILNNQLTPATGTARDAILSEIDALQLSAEKIIWNAALVSDLSDDALKDLAKSLGIVSEKSISASDAMTTLNDMYRSGKITIKEYSDMVKGLNQQLKNLEDKNGISVQMFVDVWYRQHGGVGGTPVVPSGQTNSSFQSSGPPGTTATPHATGASFTVPAGYQGDNYPILAKTGERVDIKPAGQPEAGMNELLAAIRALPSQISRSVRDAVLTA